MNEKLFEEIKAILLKQSQESKYGFSDEVTLESRLKEDFSLDSLDIVSVTLAFENKYSVLLSDEEADSWVTVGDVVNCIASKL